MGFLVKLGGKELEDIQFYLQIAVENIIEGKIIAFPTDAVYGIGGDPLNKDVIKRIYDIKFRDVSKGFLLLVSDYEDKITEAEILRETIQGIKNDFENYVWKSKEWKSPRPIFSIETSHLQCILDGDYAKTSKQEMVIREELMKRNNLTKNYGEQYEILGTAEDTTTGSAENDPSGTIEG